MVAAGAGPAGIALVQVAAVALAVALALAALALFVVVFDDTHPHRVHSNISMGVEGDTHAVRRRSAILSMTWPLVSAANNTLACRPRRNGREVKGSGMIERCTARTAIGTNARMSFSANWAL